MTLQYKNIVYVKVDLSVLVLTNNKGVSTLMIMMILSFFVSGFLVLMHLRSLENRTRQSQNQTQKILGKIIGEIKTFTESNALCIQTLRVVNARGLPLSSGSPMVLKMVDELTDTAQGSFSVTRKAALQASIDSWQVLLSSAPRNLRLAINKVSSGVGDVFIRDNEIVDKPGSGLGNGRSRVKVLYFGPSEANQKLDIPSITVPVPKYQSTLVMDYMLNPTNPQSQRVRRAININWIFSFVNEPNPVTGVARWLINNCRIDPENPPKRVSLESVPYVRSQL